MGIFHDISNLDKWPCISASATDIVKQKDVSLIIVSIPSFVANYFFKMNVILIILACAVYGVIRTILKGRKAA